jgi:hypothetical protein
MEADTIVPESISLTVILFSAILVLVTELTPNLAAVTAPFIIWSDPIILSAIWAAVSNPSGIFVTAIEFAASFAFVTAPSAIEDVSTALIAISDAPTALAAISVLVIALLIGNESVGLLPKYAILCLLHY